jgi:hypothetical protein
VRELEAVLEAGPTFWSWEDQRQPLARIAERYKTAVAA